MHILLLPSWYSTADKPWRGMFVRDQALALSRAGYEVGTVFVERRQLSTFTTAALRTRHFQTIPSREEGIATLRMKGWSLFAQTTAGALLWSELTRRAVRAYVDAYGVPDLIHGHAAMWGGYAAMLAARDLGRAYMVTEHSSAVLSLKVSRANRQRIAAVYRNAERVLAVSETLRRSVDRLAGAPVAEVVPNAVDTTYFCTPQTARTRRPFVFLAVADLVPSKRIDLRIRAFGRLRALEPHARLVIAGAGGERERLTQLARSHIEGHAVEFTGWLDRGEVRRRLWDANALVVSSDVETFSVVTVEALSTGLPVIATRCGGPEEIVTSNLGALVDRGDEAALAGAMRQMLTRRFDADELRQSARRFDYRVVARRLGLMYEGIAARDREVA